MAKAKKMTGMAPLPQYIMPDESEPEYEVILEQLAGLSQIVDRLFILLYTGRVMIAPACAGLCMVGGRYFSMNWWITINMG